MTQSHDTVAFLGLARDCAEGIERLKSYVDEMRVLGFKTSVFIGENGSVDDTRILIEQIATNEEEWTLIDTAFMSNYPNRLEKMAVGRQMLKDKLNNAGDVPEFVVVLDLDNAFKEPPTPAKIATAISKLKSTEEIFALSATSYPAYYDLLALDAPGLYQVPLWALFRATRNVPLLKWALLILHVFPAQRRVSRAVPFLAKSAFNGLTIYRGDAFILGSYACQDQSYCLCEHIHFNRSIGAATGRKLLVDSALTIRAPGEHIRRELLGKALTRWRIKLGLV